RGVVWVAFLSELGDPNPSLAGARVAVGAREAAACRAGDLPTNGQSWPVTEPAAIRSDPQQ
ncbi:hypothetical protein ABZW03_39705, partial [Kitasatospora sp. NPDC004799]|uniref:hypothetical protein n=1 Tax=Kitasatospora sp. NPDC004799 TaxID=3154460 RepID=UPI0033A7D93C